VICRIVAAFALACAAGTAQAASGASNSSTFCDRLHPLTASEQDRLLRFAAVVRDELDSSDSGLVLVSRSGLDLSRFQIRYSHAAIGWRAADGAWSARQLYYACDEARPRIFDQGLAGFVMGIDDPGLGYISIVKIPRSAADSLRRAALEPALALQLLSTRYSANAYAYSTLYQNCNQWVMEMLAVGWGGLAGGADIRTRAQAWLHEARYEPEPVAVGSRLLMFATWFMPMLHLDDHPAADRAALRLQVSLPATAEAFVRARAPDSERVEICHNGKQVVVHRGWTPMLAGCVAGDGDRVHDLTSKAR
jgi:hypothetical protein